MTVAEIYEGNFTFQPFVCMVSANVPWMSHRVKKTGSRRVHSIHGGGDGGERVFLKNNILHRALLTIKRCWILLWYAKLFMGFEKRYDIQLLGWEGLEWRSSNRKWKPITQVEKLVFGLGWWWWSWLGGLRYWLYFSHRAVRFAEQRQRFDKRTAGCI